MTISCSCPKCGQVCAFKDHYAGHRARCLKCDSRFVIPDHDSDTTEPIPDEPAGPIPGFYSAVLKENTKAFFQPESVKGIVLCIALTCFHFFIGDKDYSISLPGFRLQGPVGWVVTFICAGYLLWYFTEIINETACGCDFLPDIGIGEGFAFIGQAIKSIYCFIVTFAIALIPAFVLINALNALHLSFAWLEMTLIVVSMMGVPLVLSILACGIAPWMLFRFDRMVVIIAGTFRPYLLTTIITITAFLLVFLTLHFFAAFADSKLPAALMLAARILAVFMTIFAMRTIGLYVRHYFHCFPELKIPEY